jgi:cell division protein FtsL
MNRPAILLWLGITVALAFGVFIVAYEVRHMEEERDALTRTITVNQKAIHVLAAEWSYLNRPDRLKKLAARHLDLHPIEGSQLISLGALPRREGSDAPVPAATTDLPVLMVSQ